MTKQKRALAYTLAVLGLVGWAVLMTVRSVNVSRANRALIAAVHAGNLVEIQALLEGGANPNAADRAGHSALWLAAYYGHAAVVTALADHGADVNFRDENGFTPLMWATEEGHTAAVQATPSERSRRAPERR